jgi:tetratricopeptide (TPR) repeat protein
MRLVLLHLCLLGFCAISAQAQPTASKPINACYKRYVTTSYYDQRHQSQLDSVLHYYPDDAWLWQQKAMPLYKARQYEAGAPYLDRAVALDPKSYLDYRAFMRCIFTKSYREALVDFREAQARYGERYVMDHTYSWYIGLCHLQLHQLDSAAYYLLYTNTYEREHYGDSLIHFMNWFYLGMTRYEQGNIPEAIQMLDKVLLRYPNFADANYYKARCYMLQGKTDAAKMLLELAKGYLKQGYSITEDNEYYEPYPYQIKSFYIDNALDQIKKVNIDKRDK